MAKFKVGDRVRRTRDGGLARNFKVGFETTVASIAGSTVWDIEEHGHSADCLELVTPVIAPAITAPPSAPATTSAIRTVTRREIVPGTVDLGEFNNVEITDIRPHGVRLKTDYCFGPKSLRAAASLFNELADVLDENAGEAA